MQKNFMQILSIIINYLTSVENFYHKTTKLAP
jgi:hypothetical protein